MRYTSYVMGSTNYIWIHFVQVGVNQDMQMGDRQIECCLVVTDGRRVNQVKQLINVDRSKKIMVLGETERLRAGEGGGRGLFQVVVRKLLRR
jgi:oligoribonuclease (3'-5' exoribonuclease)